MNRTNQTILFWMGVVVILVWLSASWRDQTFSLVSWPLVLAVVVAFTVPRPWLLLLLLGLGVELIAHLSPGILLTAMFLPYPMARLSFRPASGFSLAFAVYVALIVV